MKQLIKKSGERGMTFIELIVVITIFSVLASVILFRFTDFSANVNVQNLAQEVALTIHQAQSNAISGVFDTRFNGNAPTYGVNFSIDNPKQFIYFIDSTRDGKYFNDPNILCGNLDTECLDRIEFTGDGVISEICVNKNTEPSSMNCDVQELFITFTRPFPEAVIRRDNQDNVFSDAEITIDGEKGAPRSVIIWATGQISVGQP